MHARIAHGWNEDSIESKTRWFQSLTLKERMDILCWFTDMILGINPAILEHKDAQPVAGRVRVLRQT